MQIKTLKSGEIDYEHFKEMLTINRSRPAIVNVNCGTTVKGAVDDLDRVVTILQECGYNEDRFYIHVDGALFGMMVSRLQHPTREYLMSVEPSACKGFVWLMWLKVNKGEALAYKGQAIMGSTEYIWLIPF